MEDYEQYVDRLVKEGFFSEKLEPLKCTFCESKDFERYDEYHDERGTVEYSVKCKDCETHLATWAYGTWTI